MTWEDEQQVIIISCATLNRMRYSDGRYLLVLNKNQMQNGMRVLTPIGGASHYNDPSILQALGVHLEQENSRDLRFYIDERRAKEFETWFLTKQGREIDPFRELYEEIVLEERLLGNLDRQDINIKSLGLVTKRDRSTRDPVTHAWTKFYFEVFEIDFPELSWKKMLRGIERAEHNAKLVSKKEIQSGRTIDGIKIGSNCLALFQI